MINCALATVGKGLNSLIYAQQAATKWGKGEGEDVQYLHKYRISAYVLILFRV